MANSIDSTFGKFLPKRAVVMARNQMSLIPEISEPLANHQEEPFIPKDDTLEGIAKDLEGCTRCKLCQHRKTIVFGEGHPQAELMFVGEGPGEQEDIQGRPFVGKAGQLLDKMIQAIQLRRDQVFIVNSVKCRPPGNRNPEPDEIATCSPFLVRQIAVIQPKIIVALGKFSAQTLLKTDEKISSLRGRFFDYGNAKLIPTWHPAYLLRNPAAKKEAWEDLQLVAKELGIEIPNRRGTH